MMAPLKTIVITGNILCTSTKNSIGTKGRLDVNCIIEETLHGWHY